LSKRRRCRFPVSLDAVSKHVRILERAGLVRREIRGRDHYLTADPTPLVAAATGSTSTEHSGSSEPTR
jgi:DNA-binding transcriptional ArsR family regulator